jgi:glycosyltransferase involved in cell wall biosynthesis
MRVLQINTVCGLGSTGKIATDIADALLLNGDECMIAFGQYTTTYKNSFKFGSKLENHLHNALSRLLGKQGYFSPLGTKELLNYIKNFQPDVIHLHNIHGNYLNSKLLFDFLSTANIPVVWTLHDCWAFTGKCVYYTDIGCYKWKTHCNNCPQIKKYPPSVFFDRSEEMFSDRKKWFTSVKNLTIITVSNWLAGEVRVSFLKDYPIIPVYNWIKQSVFKPTLSSFRNKYGLEKKYIILGVSAGWDKNTVRLTDFIKLSEIIPEEMQIVLVGKAKNPQDIPSKILHIPYIDGEAELAKVYSVADVFVHLSAEDTFGKVIAEALACGTPAVVYNSTACPEVLGNGCGFVVEKRDVASVYEAIVKIRDSGKESFTSKCINHVTQNYSSDSQINKILEIYKQAFSLNQKT